MSTNGSNPEGVTTQDAPRERPANVLTSEPGTPATPPDQAEPTAAAPDGAQTTDDSATSEEQRKSTRDRRAERRIRKVSRERAAAEAEAEAQRKRADELEARLRALEESAPKKERPKPKDFEDADAFLAADAAWKATQTRKPDPKPASKAPPPMTPEDRAHLERWAAEGEERLGDDFRKAQSMTDLAISVDMGEWILDADDGAEVYVHLSKHPDLAREIADESAVGAVRMLQEISAELASSKNSRPAAVETAPAKKKKGAPPPTPTRDTGAPPVRTSLEDASPAEYAAMRAAALKKKRF